MVWIPKFLRPAPAPPLLKDVGGRSFQVVGFGDNAVSIKSDLNSLVENGLKTNPLLFAGVMKIVDSFTAAPLRAYDSEGMLDTKSELARFLMSAQSPNPDMTWGEVFHMTLIFHMLTGEAYWEKIRSRASARVVEIWPLLPNRMNVIPGDSRLVARYVYRVGNRDFPLRRENIIRFPFPDPLEPQRGMSRIAPALRSIETDNTLTQHVRQLAGNNAVPPVVIKLPEGANEPSEPEKKRFLARWRESYGPKGKNDPALLPHGASVEKIGLNLQELAFKELGQELESRILMTLGVPPIVVSAMAGLQHATKANAKELREMFHEDTVAPKHRRFAEILNRYLAPEFGDGIVIRFDDSDVPAVAQQRIEHQERIEGAFEKNIVTLNEARAAWGFERDPAGDVYVNGRRWAEQPTSQDDRAQDDDDDANAASKAVQRKAAALFARKAAWTQKDREDYERLTAAGIRLSAAEEWADDLEQAAIGELTQQKRDVLDIVETRTKALDPTDADAIAAAILRKQIEWATRGSITFIPIFGEIIREAAGLASAEIGVSFDLPNVEAEKFVESYSFLFAQKMSEGTADAVRKALRRALDDGMSVPALRRMLESEIPEFGRVRAQRIARTEVIRAANAGSVEAYRNAGTVQWEWLTTSDPCPYCAALNGKIVAVGEPVFSLGDQFQPEGASRPMAFNYTAIDHPPLHPNCRCTVVPVVDGEKAAGLPTERLYVIDENTVFMGSPISESVVKFLSKFGGGLEQRAGEGDIELVDGKWELSFSWPESRNGKFEPVDDDTVFKGLPLSDALQKLVNNFQADIGDLEDQGFIHEVGGLWHIAPPESRNGTHPEEPETEPEPAGVER